MSEKSQASRIALSGCTVFVIVFVFVFCHFVFADQFMSHDHSDRMYQGSVTRSPIGRSKQKDMSTFNSHVDRTLSLLSRKPVRPGNRLLLKTGYI